MGSYSGWRLRMVGKVGRGLRFGGKGLVLVAAVVGSKEHGGWGLGSWPRLGLTMDTAE